MYAEGSEGLKKVRTRPNNLLKWAGSQEWQLKKDVGGRLKLLGPGPERPLWEGMRGLIEEAPERPLLESPWEALGGRPLQGCWELVLGEKFGAADLSWVLQYPW